VVVNAGSDRLDRRVPPPRPDPAGLRRVGFGLIDMRSSRALRAGLKVAGARGASAGPIQANSSQVAPVRAHGSRSIVCKSRLTH
jgi:hypothetical protein